MRSAERDLPRRTGAPNSVAVESRLRLCDHRDALRWRDLRRGWCPRTHPYHDNLVSNIDNGVRGTAQCHRRGRQAGHHSPTRSRCCRFGSSAVQVLNSANKVISGDPASVADPPMLTLAETRISGSPRSPIRPTCPSVAAAVVAIHTTSPTGALTIVAAASLDPCRRQDESGPWRSAPCSVLPPWA